MLEIVNQLDGFDARGNIKVLMATNRLDLLTIWLLFYEIFVAHLLLSISFCKV
jgi:hypothetical protein